MCAGPMCPSSQRVLMPKTSASLYTSVESNIRDKFQVKQKRRFLLLCQAKGGTCPQKPRVLSWGRLCCVLASCVRRFATLWTVADQAPLSMEFSRQEYWSGLPCPSQGNLHDPEMEPASPALAGGFFITEPPEGRGFIVIVQRGYDQLVDIFLRGSW